MEGQLLRALGEPAVRRRARPRVSLQDVDRRLQLLFTHAIEPTTAATYSVGARALIRFCLDFGLPLDPTPLTFARFIAYSSLSIASGARYLTGARHFLLDLYPAFDDSRSHPMVLAAIRGARKLRADPVRRKEALRLHHLDQFYHAAMLSGSYDNLLFITILSCCFYGCHRSGELVRTSPAALDARKMIKRGSLFLTASRARYVLPYHKGDPFYQGTSILHTPHSIADPVQLLRSYALRRDAVHGIRPALFLRLDGSVPTRSWFEGHLHRLLGREFGGHSARAGGATYYASLGLSADIIQALGRWSSLAWKLYIRDNPTVRAQLELASAHQPSA